MKQVAQEWEMEKALAGNISNLWILGMCARVCVSVYPHVVQSQCVCVCVHPEKRQTQEQTHSFLVH